MLEEIQRKAVDTATGRYSTRAIYACLIIEIGWIITK